MGKVPVSLGSGFGSSGSCWRCIAKSGFSLPRVSSLLRMWLLVEGSSFCSRLALLLDRSVGEEICVKRKFFGFFGFKSFFKSLDRKELLFISFAVTPDMGICLATSHLSKYTSFIAFAAITKLTFLIFPGLYPACRKVYFANVPKRLTGRSDDRSVKGARLRVESHTCAGTADRETSPWCRTTVSVSSLLESSTLKRV
jgi:hypothetical protein